ncbi:MAG: polyribonucleotide nucleotidyltransferase [Candidatus Rokuibacteriota bacterium]|nr:MAG: polyribonucleotide nucleotidyltransferase [Candidatus Rokubacteria bacterium]PYM59021.1 MAG: polyribonucleotide nucleotidyltransferase [Candidatus Rokubacteria bacterium]
MTSHTVQTKLNGRAISIETGKVAKQADGAVVVRCGGTIVLSTVVATKAPMEGRDFLPLTVEYRERAYAGGKIPGGFFKREGRPDEKETLTCRLIDRPVRPLFPKGFRNEIQVINLVISADDENDPDVLAMIGSSAALCLSGLPFGGPLGAVRVALVEGELVANPTYKQLAASQLEVVIAGTEDAVLMVESGGREISEDQMLEALAFGHEQCKALARIQQDLMGKAAKPRWAFDANAGADPTLQAKVQQVATPRVAEALAIHQKQARAEAMVAAFEAVWAHLVSVDHVPDEPATKAKAREYFEKVEKTEVRRLIVDKGIRVDGRSVKEVRPIWSEIGYLPRAHGSALFTRGETQALVAATLGTKNDEQKMESFEGDSYRHFMLHYNFPSFSTGEVKRFGTPGRREIGHGALAHRAVEAVLPTKEAFPYTIRIVSDILESNGSSSMATVCGASMALMDAGVPLKAPVAGIAMGLVKEGDKVGILTDIMGSEDHYGDMDFKVAGTDKGITALQMDIKIGGVSVDIMRQALAQAREARLHVLGKMAETIKAPRTALSEFAPRFITIRIRPEKIREIIGPGGKVIRGIQEKTGAKIDVEDDGKVTVFSSSSEKAQMAIDIIQDICREAELDRIYLGKVKSIKEFGAFVEIMQGTEGLLHISQIAENRIRAVGDVLTEGDEVLVKVIEIDANGKVRLSRKQALRDQPALADKEKLKIAPTTAGA